MEHYDARGRQTLAEAERLAQRDRSI